MIIEMMRFWYLVFDSAGCPKGLALHSLSHFQPSCLLHTHTHTHINTQCPHKILTLTKRSNSTRWVVVCVKL